MNKQDFLLELDSGLEGLPQSDREEQISFYTEMIDDRIEEGMSEEDAVAQIGNVDEVIEQILTEIPLVKIVKEKARPKRALSGTEILLLSLGSPIWLSILIALVAIVISIFVSLWSVVISLWATQVSLAASSLGGIVLSFVYFRLGESFSAIYLFGAALICAALSIFLFYGCRELTKLFFKLSKKMILGIKYLFIGRRKAK